MEEEVRTKENNENKDIKVVIVDDSDLSRAATVEAVEAGGYTISGEASSATQAVEIAGAVDSDIFIIDVVMPEISGLELAKIITEKFHGKSIIMISSLTEEKIIIDAITQGAQDFIQKPFDADTLLTSLAKISIQIRKNRKTYDFDI